jgi:hypothetical protein
VRLPVPPLRQIGGGTQIRTGDKGFAVLCLTTWLCRLIMERKTGFEPATFALARRRSTTEPLPLIHGASGQNRTTDTQIFSLLLYRLSYRGLWRSRWDLNPRPPAPKSSIKHRIYRRFKAFGIFLVRPAWA